MVEAIEQHYVVNKLPPHCIMMAAQIVALRTVGLFPSVKEAQSSYARTVYAMHRTLANVPARFANRGKFCDRTM